MTEPTDRPGRRLAARGVHRVTPADIGRRVSVRSLPAGPEGPARDVVGRLLGHADGIVVLVDRHLQLRTVDEATIVASKVIPEHPRRAAEPTDLGTPQRPLFRRASRVVLLDDDDRVLLAAHRPAADRRVWTAPGGGLRPDETHQAAAARELEEELGLDVEVGPWLYQRRVTFTFAGVHLDQEERWFLARTGAYDPADAPLDDAGLDRVRWWTVDQLRATDEVVAPHALADHLADLLRDGPPPTPRDVGR